MPKDYILPTALMGEEVALPWGLKKGRQPCQCLDVSLVRPCQDLTDRTVGKYVSIALSHRVGGNVLQQQ